MEIRWTDLAREDLQNIHDYYQPIAPVAGKRIIDQIIDKVEYLADFPKLGHKGLVKNSLELTVLNTNYIIIYKILEEEIPQIISISAIASTKQDR